MPWTSDSGVLPSGHVGLPCAGLDVVIHTDTGAPPSKIIRSIVGRWLQSDADADLFAHGQPLRRGYSTIGSGPRHLRAQPAILPMRTGEGHSHRPGAQQKPLRLHAHAVCRPILLGFRDHTGSLTAGSGGVCCPTGRASLVWLRRFPGWMPWMAGSMLSERVGTVRGSSFGFMTDSSPSGVSTCGSRRCRRTHADQAPYPRKARFHSWPAAGDNCPHLQVYWR